MIQKMSYIGKKEKNKNECVLRLYSFFKDVVKPTGERISHFLKVRSKSFHSQEAGTDICPKSQPVTFLISF